VTIRNFEVIVDRFNVNTICILANILVNIKDKHIGIKTYATGIQGL